MLKSVGGQLHAQLAKVFIKTENNFNFITPHGDRARTVNKRNISVLIPFLSQGGKLRVFLQKRTKDAVRSPDHFGFFGGGIKPNEKPEIALQREMKEELNLASNEYKFFGKYEFEDKVFYVFVLKVKHDFENQITVYEGEFGKYFEEDEINNLKIIEDDKIILGDLFSKKLIFL